MPSLRPADMDTTPNKLLPIKGEELWETPGDTFMMVTS